ncbi:hypothetical protein [Schleiferilactobacillus harbinensis]|nr:hypothetical protein [Schleiferilactobacillus harbinensis]
MIMIDWIVTHLPTVCGLVLAFLLGMVWAMYLFGVPANYGKKAK